MHPRHARQNILNQSAAALLESPILKAVTDRLRSPWAAAALGLAALQLAPAEVQAATATIDFSAGSDAGFTTSGTPSWNFTGTKWQVAGQNNANSQLTSVLETASGGTVSISFVHTFQFESGWDGGQIESSINGGAFTYVAPGVFSAGVYNLNSQLIANSLGNANPSYSSSSGVSETSTFTLGSLSAGDTFQIRWRSASDPSVTNGNPAWQLFSLTLINVQTAGFWLGQTDNTWTGANWATDAAGSPVSVKPTSGDDVVFSATGAANKNTTLGANFNIHSLTINDSAAVTIGGANTLTISGSTGTTGITVNSGAGLFTINSNLTLAGASNTIAVNNTAGAVINGVVGGTIGLTKTGTGTLTLGNAANTYTGVTTLSDGVLSVGTLANGGTASSIGQSSNAAANLVFDGGTLQYTGGTVTSDRAFTINTGETAVIDVTTGGTELSLAGATGAATDGALTKRGAGTLTLTGVSTYTGATTIEDGTLKSGVNNALDAATTLTINQADGSGHAVFDLNGKTQTVAGLTIIAPENASIIDVNGGTLTLNGDVNLVDNTDVPGNGGVAVIKDTAGGGALDLGGAVRTFTIAGQNVSNQELTVNAVIQNGGVIINAANSSTVGNSGGVYFTAANTYAGGTTINSGFLLANNTTGSATGTGSVTINSGGTLGGQGAVSGPITLNSGGVIAPGQYGSFSHGTLHGGSLTWNGGGQLNMELGTTSDLLALTGTLTKGTAGAFNVDIADAGGILNQSHYQLVTFASQSGFLASDFSYTTLIAGLNGFFSLTGTELDFNITGITTTGPIIQNSNPVGTSKIADFIINGAVVTGGPNENNQVHTLTFLPGSSLVVHNTLFVLQGPVTLPGGSTITLDGSLSASQLKMLLGSLLNGNGNILGDLFNSGLVSPGHSPGQIHVSGDFTQSPTGTLRIEIAGRDLAQHDLLSVGGKANLDGTLQLVPLDGFKLKRNKPVTFLTANGGVNGEFATIDSGFTSDTILTPTVVYHGNSVSLEAVQGSFAQLDGLTQNQKSVGRALDSAAHDTRADSIFEYLDYRKLNKLPGDLDKIAPEELTSIFTIGTSLANVQSQNIQRRTDDIRSGTSGFSAAGLAVNGSGPSYSGRFRTGVAGPDGNEIRGDGKDVKENKTVVAPEENRWGVFLSGTGEWVSVGNTDNARGYDLTSGGFTLGIDYKVTPNLAVGLAAGYTGTSADLTDRGRVYVNGGKVGLYATFFQNEQVSPAPTMSKDSSKDSKEVQAPAASIAKGFYADVAVFGGYNSYDTRRTALQGEARGDTDGGELNVLAGIGYDFKKGNLTFGPTASFNYTYLGTNGFTEHGSLAPLNVHGGEGESLRSAFGFKASYDWKVGSVLIKPEIRASWQHEFGDAAYALDASFANGAGNSFLVNGPELGRDSVLLGAGFAIQFNERFSTYFYYDGELGRKDYQSTNVTGGLRFAF